MSKAIEEAKEACRVAYARKVDALVELHSTDGGSDPRSINAHYSFEACANSLIVAQARLRESVHDAVMVEARKMT